MPANTTTKSSFIVKYRYWIIAAFMLLLLPPLAVIFQATGETNFCGTWCPRMFFVWRKGVSSGQYFMGWLRSYWGVSLVLGTLITTFFWGRYWCSHICPIGGATEFFGRFVPKWMKINFSSIPASPFRYGYLSVYLIAPAIGVGNICCSYCNFATVPRLFGAPFSQAEMAYFFRTAGLINLSLIVFLGFLAKGGRAYCNFLCPVGALDAISNRLGMKFGKRVLVNSSKCDGCGACRKVCPTWSFNVKDKTATIDQLSCMPCRLCENVCPKGAISYGKLEG